ncbi:hypothetical protein A2576_02840 [Candidatus Amesbacteria bacterium RIFOXYD1_FULL_47_9]|uniref:Uncharacterized protein n=1 Tax=Candidatus Amesbacteria bacterium RIFOXYD1_FULL_47_9 TaxID=1797267 RepID=A0A1F4ZXF6_9BACT|nr:MAG: hypothetical protein A2V48_04340 [Candidatus Amesbacteria bacterium RBG_19FT_COMBO_48_16]OGD11062.1 MAG: hypothetical protein A2576_02840 [Candidatus Amesbacteria bacterium RIFOXYD1_FULL_47_9]
MKKTRWWLVVGGGIVLVYLLGFLYVRVLGGPIPVGGTGETYVVCGCGCCGGSEGGGVAGCVYSKTEFDEIVSRDRRARGADICKYVGCSAGTKYRLCGRISQIIEKLYGVEEGERR